MPLPLIRRQVDIFAPEAAGKTGDGAPGGDARNTGVVAPPIAEKKSFVVDILVQFFLDRIWISIVTNGRSVGAVLEVVAEATGPGGAPPIPAAVPPRGGQHTQRLVPSGGAHPLGGGGGGEEAPALSEEDREYLESIRPTQSSMPTFASSSGGPAGGAVGLGLGSVMDGPPEIEVESLVGPREDPLTNIVAHRIGSLFASLGESRPIVLALGLPHPSKDPLTTIEQRHIFVQRVCEEVLILAQQQ